MSRKFSAVGTGEKFQITNKSKRPKLKMSNLFGSLDIEILDFIGIWCLAFDISKYPNTGYDTLTVNRESRLGGIPLNIES